MASSWKHRKPPDDRIASQLMLCIMPQPCVFKESCPNAHSQDELNEWKRRLEFESNCIEQDYIEPETLEECREEIIQKMNESENPEHIKSIVREMIGGHVILCDENLYTMHLAPGKELFWVFTVKNTQSKATTKLEKVYFLNSSPHFHITSCVVNLKNRKVKSFKLSKGSNFWKNQIKIGSAKEIKVLVQFKAEKVGNYGQELIFDFGGYPKVVKRIGVQVENEESLTQFMKFDSKKEENNELGWRKNYEIKPFNSLQKDCDQGEIKYPLPTNIENLVLYDAFKHLDIRLTKSNYRQRLHTLLHIEEYQRRADLQCMTFHVEDFVVCLSEVKSRRMDSKTAAIELNDVVLELLTKLVGKSGKALLRINGYATPVRVFSEPIVYEVIVQNIVNGKLILEMNDQCFSIVKKSPIPVDIDVCFCLIDVFQSMHSAVENVNLDLLFPNMTLSKSLPESRKSLNMKDEELSVDQKHAIDVIMRPVVRAPVILLGPFGAGKTMTIACCIDRILSQADTRNKILLCTHSNSAADHYIEEYFHPKHQTSKSPYANQRNVPLRINWEHRYTSSVSDKVLTYCLQDLNTGLFASPKKEDLDKANIVICTLVTSESMYKLNLPKNYFTHIFIDEAAQAMEVEALVPLLLATPHTKIVLAGDHLQMGESLSSLTAKNLGLEKSLLERLFEYYPFDLEYKLKLLENFRSYKEIVDLSSHLFYEDSLICNKQRSDGVPFPVEFHGTEGEENLSNETPSYENMDEAFKILELIQQISTEENKDYKVELSSICVVAFYPAQVRRIRKVLRKNQLYPVRVESVNNIQGLEFDILLISTVRTYCNSTFNDESLSKDMGFFTNPKLLNTAITRARYRVFFVGDARALCTIGECKPCWKFIMRYCVLYNTFQNHESFVDLIDSIKTIEESRKAAENTNTADQNLDILERLELEENSPDSPLNSLPDISHSPISKPNLFSSVVKSGEASPHTSFGSPSTSSYASPSKVIESPTVLSPVKEPIPQHSTDTPSAESTISSQSEASSSQSLKLNHNVNWSTQSLSAQSKESLSSPYRNLVNQINDDILQDDNQSSKDVHPEEKPPSPFEKLVQSFSPFPPPINDGSATANPIFQPISPPNPMNTNQQSAFSQPNVPPGLPPNTQQMYQRSYSAEPVAIVQNPSFMHHPLYQRSTSSDGARHVSNPTNYQPIQNHPPGFRAPLYYNLPNIPQAIPFQPTGYNLMNRVGPGDVRFVHNPNLPTTGQPIRPVQYVLRPIFRPGIVSGHFSPNRQDLRIGPSVAPLPNTHYGYGIESKPTDLNQLIKQPSTTLNLQSNVSSDKPLSDSRQILTVAATCKLTLRHKIQFLHDYCVHVLESLNANSHITYYIKRSTINAFQDLDSCEGVPETMARKILTEVEVKMETNYTLVHDHITENTTIQSPDTTTKTFIDRIEKIDQKLLYLSVQQSNGSCKSDRTILLEFFWKMLTFELDICRTLEKGLPKFKDNNTSGIKFLEIKLSFLDVKLNEYQTLFEKFAFLNNEDPPSIFDKKEQSEWFAKRRDDPYVREYQAAFDRRMARRLPSPTLPL